MEDDGFIDITVALQPAIYALLYRGRLMYIGKSKLPVSRIAQHKTKIFGSQARMPFGARSIPFDEVKIKPCTIDNITELEINMIQKYRPKYNVLHNEDPVAEIDLQQVLSALIPDTKTELHRRI